jgi:hypothetical protein
MPLGGFYGTDPAMTRGRLASLVADHQLRFVDTSGFSLGANTSEINALVAQACSRVDPGVWHGAAPGSLYDCAGRQHAIRTVTVSAASAAGRGPGAIRLGPPAALQRLLSWFRRHHWNPTSTGPQLTTSTAHAAIAACASLIPAAAQREVTSATWCRYIGLVAPRGSSRRPWSSRDKRLTAGPAAMRSALSEPKVAARARI